VRWEVPFSCGVVCSKLLYVLTVSGANNSEQNSTLEIVTVPCTNQALLALLALATASSLCLWKYSAARCAEVWELSPPSVRVCVSAVQLIILTHQCLV